LKLTEQEVRNVAGLANLRLTEDEVHRMTKDLDEILSHIDKLNELDTTAIEPMSQVLFESEPLASLREDVEHEPLGTATALKNAPISGAGHFKVPRVIER
jgi:aspartyl-tRNA(Asn)/glutamyl-tRNA(Gln) amidotransferase subunit C